MTDEASEKAGGRPARHRHRRRRQRDQGGRRRRRHRAPASRSGSGCRRRCRRPRRRSSPRSPGWSGGWSSPDSLDDDDPGRGRPARRDHRRRAQVRRQHRPGLDRLSRSSTGCGKVLKRPIFIINDADAAGIAEMRFGVGKGRPGTVIFLTLGTGVGSGVFIDGVLVPNTEFGQMEIRGRAAEKRSAAVARVRRGLSWKAWAADLDEHLDRIQQLMWPNLMILGGGVSKSADKFIPRLTVKCEVVPAELRNDAGIIGAAIVAAENPRPGGRRRVGRAANQPRPPARRRHDDRQAGNPGTLFRRGPDPGPDGHRRRVGRCRRRADVRRRQPGDGEGDRDRAARRSGGRGPGGRGGPARVRRPQGLGDLGGRQAWPDAGQVRLADQGQHRGAGPAREPERRQADHRRARRDHRGEPRLRLLRRGRQQDLRADDPGLEARAST